jgi:hypothetical protein
MWLTVSDFKAVFWFAVIPAFLAMGFMIFGVSEPERPAGLRKIQIPLSWTLANFRCSETALYRYF